MEIAGAVRREQNPNPNPNPEQPTLEAEAMARRGAFRAFAAG